MARNNQGLGNQGRLSSSLGGSDPRARRNAQGLTNEPQIVRRPLAVDRRTGAIAIEPAKAVTELAAGASAADAVDKINQIIRSLQSAGLMEK